MVQISCTRLFYPTCRSLKDRTALQVTQVKCSRPRLDTLEGQGLGLTTAGTVVRRVLICGGQAAAQARGLQLARPCSSYSCCSCHWIRSH